MVPASFFDRSPLGSSGPVRSQPSLSLQIANSCDRDKAPRKLTTHMPAFSQVVHHHISEELVVSIGALALAKCLHTVRCNLTKETVYRHQILLIWVNGPTVHF